LLKVGPGRPAARFKWPSPPMALVPPCARVCAPLTPPIPLFATVGVTFNAFLDLSVGFDTRGLLDGHFQDGFYFGDRANVTTGDDIPEFGFGLELAVGLELNLGIVSFRVGGGGRGDLDFNWNDLDNNGKTHFDEQSTLYTPR